MGTAQVKKQPIAPPYDVAEDTDERHDRPHMPTSAHRYQPDVANVAEDTDERYELPRMPTSVRRYQPMARADVLDEPSTQPGAFIQRRRSRSSSNPGLSQPADSGTTSKAVAPTRLKGRRSLRRLPLLALGAGMLLAVLLGLGLSAFGNWWQIHQDDTQYGRPRTFQLDGVVGHGDSPSHMTHFIFVNLNRHVEIMEFSGGDASHAHIYNGPVLFGDGQDLTPITGSIYDVNGDGKPDLVVHFDNQRLALINTGNAFRPANATDHITF